MYISVRVYPGVCDCTESSGTTFFLQLSSFLQTVLGMEPTLFTRIRFAKFTGLNKNRVGCVFTSYGFKNLKRPVMLTL